MLLVKGCRREKRDHENIATRGGVGWKKRFVWFCFVLNLRPVFMSECQSVGNSQASQSVGACVRVCSRWLEVQGNLFAGAAHPALDTLTRTDYRRKQDKRISQTGSLDSRRASERDLQTLGGTLVLQSRHILAFTLSRSFTGAPEQRQTSPSSSSSARVATHVSRDPGAKTAAKGRETSSWKNPLLSVSPSLSLSLSLIRVQS